MRLVGKLTCFLLLAIALSFAMTWAVHWLAVETVGGVLVIGAAGGMIFGPLSDMIFDS